MTYDCFTFNGEFDILEIRFNLLSALVDKFIIVEGTETFSGLPKLLYWKNRDKARFKQWEDKVIYQTVDSYEESEILQQIQERNYIDTVSFQRAFYQKEVIRKVLENEGLKDNDIVYYGDVDEVWKPQVVDEKTHKLRQLAYSYYLNNRSPEDWRGTIVTKWKNIQCLNDLRANPIEDDILQDGGWHWTNLGGLEAVKSKIESYDHQEVNIPWVKDGLAQRIADNKDFLGRDYQMWVDDSQLPQYLLDTKEQWKLLWK